MNKSIGYIVQIEQSKIRTIDEWIKEAIEHKSKEGQYKRDGISKELRWKHGLMGEMAVEQLTGEKFINWDIGHSIDYNIPDMYDAGYAVGIKTVEREYQYPLIPIKNYYPQIICWINSDTEVEVLGLALPRILNKYQDSDKVIVRNPWLLQHKTAFTGLDHLDDIADYKKFQI